MIHAPCAAEIKRAAKPRSRPNWSAESYLAGRRALVKTFPVWIGSEGQLPMPRLHKYRERNACYVLTAIRGAVITYQLTPDGERKLAAAGIAPATNSSVPYSWI